MAEYDLIPENKELFDSVPNELTSLFDGKKYPWEVIGDIKNMMNYVDTGGYLKLRDGVFVGEGVSIAETVTILPPAIIGSGSELRPGAYLRGNVFIGKGCVIGNSTELKNAIIMDGAQIPHYNYVGDSILGCRSHMGAGAIASNLKSDHSNVTVHADRDYATGLRKMGAVLGDEADVGCGCVLNPGTVIGKRSRVYPLTSVRGSVGADMIVKSPENVVKMNTGGV